MATLAQIRADNERFGEMHRHTYQIQAHVEVPAPNGDGFVEVPPEDYGRFQPAHKPRPNGLAGRYDHGHLMGVFVTADLMGQEVLTGRCWYGLGASVGYLGNMPSRSSIALPNDFCWDSEVDQYEERTYGCYFTLGRLLWFPWDRSGWEVSVISPESTYADLLGVECMKDVLALRKWAYWTAGVDPDNVQITLFLTPEK